MQKSSPNTFKDGMLIGVHPSVQSNSSTRKVKNFRIITRDNNSFILTNVRGNEFKSAISEGFVPLCIEDKKGVAYILSAQVIDGVATGVGEIGTFPSPDYTTGNLVYEYKPLKNYAQDDGSAPAKNGNFRSSQFKFTLEDILDVELQNDYDGSVNIIFTDGKNPMRMINSAFVVLPGNKWKVGSVSTNKYTIENFENTIGLIIRSAKILKVEFNESVAGGSVLYGNYEYYFAYSTADGNETDVVAQSFNVSVFDGDKIGNISGGKLTGDKSNKLNRFTLTNVDKSYSYLSVFVVHSDGMNANVKTAFRISQKYPITQSTMQFVHTGYEEVERIDVNSLTSGTETIGTASTIAQTQGYLIAADIKEKQYNVEVIRRFCKLIRLGHKEQVLDMIGNEENFTRAYDEPINQSAIKVGTDGYNGGYANPKNIHDKLGYWGGESYAFTARLIFPDGYTTPLFPVSGVDNAVNTNGHIVENATEGELDAIEAAGGFDPTSGGINPMLNTRGIYRFPNRNAAGAGKLFSMVDGQGRMTVNGITFCFNDPVTGTSILDKDLRTPQEVTDGLPVKTIKDITIGIQFFRGQRKEDVLLQGTAIDVEMIPNIRWDTAGADGEGQKLWNWNANSGYSESNSMFVPAYGHILESIDVWRSQDGSNGQRRSFVEKAADGIVPFKMNSKGTGSDWTKGRDPNYILTSNKSPFALISSDAMVNPARFSDLSARSINSKLLYKVTHKGSFKSTRAGQPEGTGDHFSVLVPKSLVNQGTTVNYNGQASWTDEGAELRNSIGFSSMARFQCRHDNSSNWYLFRNKYNSYIGLRLDASIKASNPQAITYASDDTEGGREALGLLDTEMNYSFLMNVYNGGAQRSSLAVSQLYNNIDGISYFPISGKMYWNSSIVDADASNTLQSQLDGNKKITLFNGDCFINFALRKLYVNSDIDDPDQPIKNDLRRLGYSIGVINEGNYNASLRSSQTVDLIEGERKHPFQYVNKSSGTGDALGRNNLWREYTLMESSGYNKGYNSLLGDILAVTLPQNVPFTESNWFCRVWHSAKHIPNSFENGYRSFFSRSYKDYNPKNGRIVKLIVNNDKLYCIQETSVGIIPINERIQTGGDSAGAIFVESSGVLGPKMGMISEEVGSRHKNSIVSTDNGVYGASLERNIVWYTDGGPLNRLSDLSIRPFLQEQYGDKSKIKINVLSHDIVAIWNKKYDEVLFTYYNKEADYVNDRTFTIQVNEISKKIHSFYGFIPVNYFLVGDDLYSFSITSTKNIWLHDSTNPAIPLNNFYGTQHKSSIAFSINADSESNKDFSNLELISNNVMPETIKYFVQGAKTEHDLVSDPENIITTNAKYKNQTWRITIPKIKTVHNQDAEQKFSDTSSGAGSLLGIKSRVKGRFMITEIIYNTNDLIELQSATTFYKIMR